MPIQVNSDLILSRLMAWLLNIIKPTFFAVLGEVVGKKPIRGWFF